jgi:hypothetical protein
METATLASQLASVDFSVILDSVISMVPIVIPVILAFLGFKKGLAFVKRQIKGA